MLFKMDRPHIAFLQADGGDELAQMVSTMVATDATFARTVPLPNPEAIKIEVLPPAMVLDARLQNPVKRVLLFMKKFYKSGLRFRKISVQVGRGPFRDGQCDRRVLRAESVHVNEASRN
jgi:hypothetical protein